MSIDVSEDSSTLKIEEIYSSETSADFERAVQHYIPEDIISIDKRDRTGSMKAGCF
jgi:hypothetical protein